MIFLLLKQKVITLQKVLTYNSLKNSDMKKLLMLLVCTLMLSTSANAWKLISLTVQVIHEDEQPITHGHSKSPDETPTVYIDDYTLFFETNHPEYVLNIKDEDGDVVYTTVVYSAQTQVVLPSTLSGDYEIEIIDDDLLFVGWINL
jgi:hypothetical protein